MRLFTALYVLTRGHLGTLRLHPAGRAYARAINREIVRDILAGR